MNRKTEERRKPNTRSNSTNLKQLGAENTENVDRTDTDSDHAEYINADVALDEPMAGTNELQGNVTNAELKELILGMQANLLQEINSLKTEVRSLKEKVNKNVDNIGEIKTSINHDADRLTTLENKTVPEIHKKIVTETKRLEKQIVLQEIHDRKQNLLFYGIPQASQDENVYEVVRNTLVSDFGFSVHESRMVFIANAHRLPRRRLNDQQTDQQQAPDPIIVRFSNMVDREWVLRNQRARPFVTDKKPVMAYTDLPPKMKKQRGDLVRQAKTLRSEGNTTRIKTIETDVILEYRPRGNRDARWQKYTP